MEISSTLIVSIIGLIGVLFYGYESKITGFLKAKKEIHDEKQSEILKKVEITKDEIIQSQEEIKKIEEKIKNAEDTVEVIASSTNEDVKKILKDEKVDTLIKEFSKW